jgi:hypothetical protein
MLPLKKVAGVDHAAGGGGVDQCAGLGADVRRAVGMRGSLLSARRGP